MISYINNGYNQDYVRVYIQNDIILDKGLEYNRQGLYNESKEYLQNQNSSIDILNYAILYDPSYYSKAITMDPNNPIILFEYMIYNEKDREKLFKQLFSFKNHEYIGYFLFHIGFEFDNKEDYKNADICFKYLKRLDPNKKCNTYWIEEGKRLISL